MRRTIASLALLATAAEAFAPAAAGGIARASLPNTRAISGLRGGSARGLTSTKMASAHDFKLPLVGGGEKSLADYKGKVVLIENVASLWGTTTSDFTAMNALVDKFGDKIAVLGVPSNQFGHQTNEGDAEFVNTLKHVRPGGGFEFKGELFACTKVNGAQQQPLFKWMKETQPIPHDTGAGDTKGNGCNDSDALILPRGAFDSTTVTLWSPVARSDIAWNFEKFLVGKDGKLIQRFGRYFPTADIAPFIEKAL